jgi:palmitoyltransferase
VHVQVAPFVFAACVISWRKAMRSSPGLITANTLHLYDHFPYDEWMFVSGKTCATRNIPRLARSKFDRFKYNENVARYDHYCGWVYNTIGEENYRWFLLFLFVHVAMCVYGAYVVGALFYGVILEQRLMELVFFDRFTGEEIPATRWIVFQYLFHKHMMEAAVLTIMVVMAIVLGLFLLYNSWLISRGLTSNESYKWNQIQKWYDRELQRYQDAIRNGTIQTTTTKTEPTTTTKGNVPIVTDGDVTCTGGSGKEEENTSSTSPNDGDNYDILVHPGRRPKNIYDRGFVENWKEVLFPISIQKAKQLSKNKTKAI